MGRIRTRITQPGQERRARTRYPLQLELCFTVRPKGKPEVFGSGRSVDLSSTGLSLRSRTRLNSGESLLVKVEWPVPSENGVPQHLVLFGRVVWTRGFNAGLSVWWHDYVPDTDGLARQLTTSPEPLPASQLEPEPKIPLILVVEASDVYVLIRDMLARCRHTIQHVSLEAALEIFQDPKYTVDLLVTHSLQEFLPAIYSVPVIYTTFRGQPQPQEAELAGFPAIVVLQKPLRFNDLRAAVYRLLSRAQAAAASGNRGGASIGPKTSSKK